MSVRTTLVAPKLSSKFVFYHQAIACKEENSILSIHLNARTPVLPFEPLVISPWWSPLSSTNFTYNSQARRISWQLQSKSQQISCNNKFSLRYSMNASINFHGNLFNKISSRLWSGWTRHQIYYHNPPKRVLAIHYGRTKSKFGILMEMRWMKYLLIPINYLCAWIFFKCHTSSFMQKFMEELKGNT
jgi:hypothetical protein